MIKLAFCIVVSCVLFIGLPVFVYSLTHNQLSLGYNKNYKPTQPLSFSHEKHAGIYKIACQYCHTTTEVSRHASLPSLNICMNCHLNVKKSDPSIQKLKKAYDNNRPILWKKVHMLPDFVKFNHAAHVNAGKKCQECHGSVETMPVVLQWSDLSMGWCVNCHRKPENQAPINCSTCHY